MCLYSIRKITRNISENLLIFLSILTDVFLLRKLPIYEVKTNLFWLILIYFCWNFTEFTRISQNLSDADYIWFVNGSSCKMHSFINFELIFLAFLIIEGVRRSVPDIQSIPLLNHIPISALSYAATRASHLLFFSRHGAYRLLTY